MKLWLACVLALALAGCESSDSTGPVINVQSGGTVLVNVTDGSSSPIGTAPCGATSGQKGSVAQDAPDCSTQANGNNSPTSGPEAVIP